jgi:uncharacterized membrane protein
MRRKSVQQKRYRYRTNKQDLDWSEERADNGGNLQNIGEGQRLISAVAGAGLLVAALPKRSWVGALLAAAGMGLLYRATSGYCPAFGALGIDTHGENRDTNRLGRRKVHSEQATKIVRSVEINRPPNELYRFWRSLENLPRVMSHLESVQVITDRLSHWAVKTLPGLPTVEWDAEIINDVENERIGWRSLNGVDVDNTGSVKFEPTANGQGTKLTVTLQYAPPAGKIGAAIAKLLGEDPNSQIAEDLRRFKESMETGVYSHGSHRQ